MISFNNQTCDSSIVSFEKVFFCYSNRTILSDLSLEFQKGKIIAIMGPSGCGKTTMLRLISGQIIPNKGRVLFNNQDIGSMRLKKLMEVRRQMGMLLQFGALFTDMSIFENVAFPLRENTNLTERTIRDLVLMKLNAVGLRGARSLLPSQISGGMIKRAALARAIALDPPLLMYDEPFSGLDPISLKIIAYLIRDLNKALNATTILVTHDIPITFTIADYVYFISNGKILAIGTPEDLLSSTDPFTKQFFSAEIDGPMPFHYPSESLYKDFRIPI